MTEKQTRKNCTPIKVYCLPEEKLQIEANAAATGLSVIRRIATQGRPALRGCQATACMESYMKVTQTRKNSTPIKVYCLPDEKILIQENAEASGLSVACFVRRVAMGYQVDSIVDIKQVNELSRVNADLGRLGGLLKLWLANDPRTVDFSPTLIRTLLAKIESTRQELRNIMDKILDK